MAAIRAGSLAKVVEGVASIVTSESVRRDFFTLLAFLFQHNSEVGQIVVLKHNLHA